MEKKIIDPSTINGWGIDADPANEPNYPIKHYTGDDHQRINWQRPSLQPTDSEILMSTERPYMPAVFGSALPPAGLSGALRRLAYTYSENMFRRWIPLLIADRIDVLENKLRDLFSGDALKCYKEKGWAALAKYKPATLAVKIIVRLIVLAAIASVVIHLFKKKKTLPC